MKNSQGPCAYPNRLRNYSRNTRGWLELDMTQYVRRVSLGMQRVHRTCRRKPTSSSGARGEINTLVFLHPREGRWLNLPCILSFPIREFALKVIFLSDEFKLRTKKKSPGISIGCCESRPQRRWIVFPDKPVQAGSAAMHRPADRLGDYAHAARPTAPTWIIRAARAWPAAWAGAFNTVLLFLHLIQR